MGKIAVIYEALLNRKEKLCHRSEIIEIINEYNKTIGKIDKKNALWYLSRHNYIRRILFGFYYINSMDERERHFCNYEDKELLFMILNKLKIKWYIGLNSALYLLGKRWQIPNTLTLINSKLSGKRKMAGINVRFIKAKEKLFFGLKQGRSKNNIAYFFSDLAKTYLDTVYFKESDKLTKTRETKKYIVHYPKWLSKLT